MGEVGKLFPLRDSLKFPEFAEAIRREFNIREWDRLSLRHGTYPRGFKRRETEHVST
jgi:hypothetical protein